MIFQPLYPDTNNPADIFFYGEFFSFSTAHRGTNEDGNEVFVPEPGTDMFVVQRHHRQDGSRVGDIFKLTDICEFVELVPKFGQHPVPDGINCDNSLELFRYYYINNFAAKETFHAILSYQ